MDMFCLDETDRSEAEEEKKPDASKVDVTTYNLIYIRKSDRRKFLGKLITKLDRKLIDSETGDILEITEYRLRKEYQHDKKNNAKNKNCKNF